MPEVLWANDEAKGRSREVLLNFILENYPWNLKQPESLRVLCFPGREAADIFQVYDRLGITRQNITGLEEQLKEYRLIKKLKLGIDLRFQNDYNCLTEATERGETFDIIFLDYCGNYTDSISGVASIIGGKKLLNDHGIIAVNISGAREMRVSQCELVSALESIRAAKNNIDYEPNLNPQIDKESRDFGVTYELAKALCHGGMAFGGNPVFEALPGHERINEEIIKSLHSILLYFGINKPLPVFNDRKSLDSNLVAVGSALNVSRGDSNTIKVRRSDYVWQKEELDEIVQKLSNVSPAMVEVVERKYDYALKGNQLHNSQYEQAHSDNLHDYCRARGFADSFVGLLCFSQIQGYNIAKMKRISYVSNKRTPMLMDIFQVVNRQQQIMDKFGDSFVVTYEDRGMQVYVDGIRIIDTADPEKEEKGEGKPFRKKMAELGVFFTWLSTKPLHQEKYPPREYLGASKYEKPREKIELSPDEKQEIRFFISCGFPTQAIVDSYPGITAGQIVAIKAHETMGTYDRN